MTEHINLREAIEILDSYDDPFKASEDERIGQFLYDVEKAGQDILSPLDPDYLMGAISFLQSTSVSGLIAHSNNDLNTMMFGMALMNSDDFAKVVTILFKFCVGLSAIEELR